MQVEGNLTRRCSLVENALIIYFDRFHRQPLHIFEKEIVDDVSSFPNELVASLLALTSHVSGKHDVSRISEARTSIMDRIANSSVDLHTIRSLALLAYAYLLGQYHHS